MVTPAFDRLTRTPAFQDLFQAAQHREVPKNQVIIAEGAKPENLYLIVSGLVAVWHVGSRGRELLLAYLYPGNFFGEMCLFGGLEARSAMIKSCTQSRVLEIDYESFLQLTRRHESLWLELAGQLAARLRSTNHRLAELPVLPAMDRVWLAIVELATHTDVAPLPEGKPVQITRQDLGKLAGCSREVAGMALAQLARAGRLRLRGRTVIVPLAALDGAA